MLEQRSNHVDIPVLVNTKGLGGGTAIIIKKSIRYEIITSFDTEKEKILEHTVIKITILEQTK